LLLDINGKASFDYGICVYSARFLLDRHGELIDNALGARDWSSVDSRNLIQYLIDQNRTGINGQRQKLAPDMETKKYNYRAFVLVFLVVAALVIVFALKQNNPYLKFSPLETGVPAPNFTLPALDGNMVSLSDHKGHVVLVNIWATWCPPCVDEMPSMERLYQELKGENFEILAVSIDALGEKAVAPFMKKYKLSFPALMDPDGTIKDPYQTTGVPESFIINKDGILVEKIIGPRNWADPAVVRYLREMIRSGSPKRISESFLPYYISRPENICIRFPFRRKDRSLA
jgi:peroxiredoxin